MDVNCLPVGICSWNYELSGSGLEARTSLSMMGESGGVSVNGRAFSINKSGVLAPKWLMEEGAQVIAEASSESLLTRAMVIFSGADRYVLSASSAFGREFELAGKNAQVRYTPSHMFTRRAVMSGQCERAELAVFGFWLAALSWKRSQNNSASSSSN